METIEKLPVLGILLGDPTGVGPEIVTKLAAADFYKDVCYPIFIGDMRVFQAGLDTFGGKADYYAISDVSEADWDKGYPVLDTKDQDPARIKYGAPDPYCGAAMIESFKLACRLCQEGKIEGFAFAPCHKQAMIDGGMKVESEHHLIAGELGATSFGETNYVDGVHSGEIKKYDEKGRLELKGRLEHKPVYEGEGFDEIYDGVVYDEEGKEIEKIKQGSLFRIGYNDLNIKKLRLEE